MPKIKINIDIIADTETKLTQVITEVTELVDPSTLQPHKKILYSEREFKAMPGVDMLCNVVPSEGDLLDSILQQETDKIQAALEQYGDKYGS